MKILVCNAGSTSLKFKLYDMPKEEVLAECRVERIADPKGGRFFYQGPRGDAVERMQHTADYRQGIGAFLKLLTDENVGAVGRKEEIAAVGFKTVLSKGHYGVHLLTEEVLQGMRDYMTVAPVHNSCYLQAIAAVQEELPGIARVGVFETAFHQTMPKEAYLYSLPYEWHEKYGIRRLGYHGASHGYVASCLDELEGGHYRAVSCHLGGSGSLAAIVDGKCVDTSFGMSLQTGIPQTNRSGDIDPFLIFHMVQAEGMPLEEVQQQMQTNGGLLGISGVSGDLRDILEVAEENERARLAVEIYCREIARYIGGYAAIMGGLDAIAFTGGIGENSAVVRQKVLGRLAFLGVCQGKSAKKGEISCISSEESRVRAYVIPANEELGVARKTANLLKSI